MKSLDRIDRKKRSHRGGDIGTELVKVSSSIMEKYSDYSDEEMIELIRQGDEALGEFLISKYKPLVKSRARSLYLIGGEQDDLLQEGMIGLFEAIKNYDKDKNILFSTFADVCVSNHIKTAISAASRLKHRPLNDSVSIYSSDKLEPQGHTILELVEMLPSTNEIPQDEQLINEELFMRIDAACENELSPMEREAFKLYRAGMDYVEIAMRLSKTPKVIDNALNRSKNKIRAALLREQME